MNNVKLVLVATLCIPALSWAAGQGTSACGSNCVVLPQRLEQLDCTNAIQSGRKFLLDGHKVVRDIPRNAPSIQREIAALRKGLQSHSQTMTDCLNKHRTNKEYSSAILPFMMADFALEKLSGTSGMLKHAQDMLIHQYEEAMETVSKLASR